MSNYESLKITKVDHVEFAVSDLNHRAELFCRLGFEKVAVREMKDRKLRSYLMAQNDAVIVLSSSSLATDPIFRFVSDHGDGVYNIAFRCDDAVSAFEAATNRGAEAVGSPKAFKKDFGSVEFATVRALGDVRHTFLSREGNLFSEGFDLCILAKKKGFGLAGFDHFTFAVDSGQIDKWKAYYRNVFGLESSVIPCPVEGNAVTHATVLQSSDGLIKMIFNEPSPKAAPVQHFIDVHHGPGIQAVALSTDDILASAQKIQQAGIHFLNVPGSYYRGIESRVGKISENLSELETLNVMVDGSAPSYLLQGYTDDLFGLFFFEIIQRRGNTGFGEANFEALQNALHSEKIHRGILEP
jgi:4-hydroxyphenylpyruvate dioxygenase